MARAPLSAYRPTPPEHRPDVPEEALDVNSLRRSRRPILRRRRGDGWVWGARELRARTVCTREEQSRPGRQARPEGSALTAPRFELSPATMVDDRREAVMVAMVVGHSGPHHCSAGTERGIRVRMRRHSFVPLLQGQGPGLNGSRMVGPGGAWCGSATARWAQTVTSASRAPGARGSRRSPCSHRGCVRTLTSPQRARGSRRRAGRSRRA
jgi:hypothetical protein